MLQRLAPAFLAHGNKRLGDRLVKHVVAGNAWHADHIRPVYKGGGLCHLENLRTLCVPCHMVRVPGSSISKEALQGSTEDTHKQC